MEYNRILHEYIVVCFFHVQFNVYGQLNFLYAM